MPAVAEEDVLGARAITVWRRFRRHRIALVGAVVLALWCSCAVFGHVVYPVDPNAIDHVNWTGYPLAPGVAGHPLGTDENGRDLLARLIAGAQVSLTVAVFAVLMEVVIGTFLGAIAGYYGGWVDFVHHALHRRRALDPALAAAAGADRDRLGDLQQGRARASA